MPTGKTVFVNVVLLLLFLNYEYRFFLPDYGYLGDRGTREAGPQK